MPAPQRSAIAPMTVTDWDGPMTEVAAPGVHHNKSIGGVALAALNENVERRSARRTALLVQIICLASQFGLWYTVAASLSLAHAFEGDPELQGLWLFSANPFIASAIILVPLSTLVVFGLLWFHYAELGKRKSMEWRSAKSSFQFWRSSFKYYLLAEMLLHLPQPIFGMDVDSVGYKTLICLMMLRMYTVFRPFVLLYKDLFMSGKNQVQAHKVSAALHLMFYRHTFAIVVISMVVLLICCSFLVLLFERHAPAASPAQSFSRLPNVMWFSFVTSLTIGYGDMFPTSTGGRLITVLLGCIMIVILAVFGGVITNKLAPDREMLDFIEEEEQSQARITVSNSAAALIQAAWRGYKRHPNAKNVYKAIKSFHLAVAELKTAKAADDPIVEEKLTALIERMTGLEETLLSMKTDMLELQRLMADVLLANETLMTRYSQIKQKLGPSPETK